MATAQARQDSEYLATARRLAEAHHHADSDTRLIFLNHDPAEREIRLLEVSGSAPTTRELYPFAFTERRDLGINFPSIVLLLSPTEWDEVQSGHLTLPIGWSPIDLMPIFPANAS
jgi:hypothetical protein